MGRKTAANKIAHTFMTKSLLDVVDPTGDSLSWFETIRSLLTIT